MRFELLGPVRVHDDRGEIPVTADRERALLAMLLLHPNRTVPTGQLVEAVWGIRPPAGARNQLQGCVSRLRKRLAGPDPVIRTDTAGYRAVVRPDQLDLLEFRGRLAEARAAATAGRAGPAIVLYRAALALWRGPALAGIDSDPVRYAAAAIDEEQARALAERLELELAAGAAGELVAELTDLVGQHPHREPLHRMLMLALYRAGRQADALATYRRARQVLHDDLGTEPGAELRRLHQAILNRDPALDPPRPATEPARSGEQFPVPRELPADVAGFTGRAEALKALDELLPTGTADPPAPVVISAIAGTAGVGKTALAVHWAHQVADQFPDGQLFLHLRGYATGSPLRPVEALAGLLRSLGTPPEQIPTDETQAAALYRTRLAGRRVLVVLDNARSVDQVRPLLPGSPGCLVVVTSRDRLTGLVARDGAHRLTLDVLTPDEAKDLLITVVGPERVRPQAGAAARLAAACAYLPLALRVTAADLLGDPGRKLDEHVARLTAGDRINALRAEGDEEHAVRAVFDQSYRSIPAPAQRMFRLLGLMPGADVTTAAAAALVGIPREQADRQLRQLASGHLLDEATPGRYTFHDLLRRYARQLAEELDGAGERSAAVERLLQSYLVTVEAATGLLSPRNLRLPRQPPPAAATRLSEFDETGAAVGWLAAEQDNLVAAVRHAAEHGPSGLVGPLAESISHYFWHARRTVEWQAVATVALRSAEQADDLPALTVAQLSLGGLCFNLADYPAAREHYQVAAGHAERLGWTGAEGTAYGGLALVAHELGELTPAADHFARASALYQRSGMLGAEASNLSNLAGVQRDLGHLQQAFDALSRALTLSREIGSAAFEAAILNNLGALDHELGRFDSAVERLHRALALHDRLEDRNGRSIALDTLAAVLRDAGRLAEARDRAQVGLALTVEVGNPADEAFARNTLGSVQLRLGDPEAAVAQHQQALDLARQTGSHQPQVEALIGLADTGRQLGQPDRAVGHAREALSLAREVGYQVLAGRALTCLAGGLLGHGDLGAAEESARKALANHLRTGHRLGQARTLAVLGQIADAAGRPEEAHRLRREAQALLAAIGAAVPADLRSAGATASGPARPG